KAAATQFGIDPERTYGSVNELVDSELRLPEDQRIDFVSIATPNHTHFAIAKTALGAGFNVVCDKPMTTRVEEAEELVRLVEETGCVFALTHNYTGYPMVRQAREMVLSGELGSVQAIRANYIQGWLRGLQPGVAPSRGTWKDDPEKAGPSGAMADIGTHAFNLLRFITDLIPAEISCQLRTFAPDRQLDDYGHATIKFPDGAVGSITVSQVTHGRLNDLEIEIDGTKGSIAWRQEQPNELIVRRFGDPMQVYERNPMAPFTAAATRRASRLPGGHPEAFFEAFANIYTDAFDDMVNRHSGRDYGGTNTIYPNVYDGAEGVRFIENCVGSSRKDGAWLAMM
ncbi:MAG: Gfo/Idh/MocA family oxidoreductase, partial [Planctomycetes bacterium]|nr:Gfo/Idh/MocA family oxidoreductase [Planctomycetota bacterium]